VVAVHRRAAPIAAICGDAVRGEIAASTPRKYLRDVGDATGLGLAILWFLVLVAFALAMFAAFGVAVCRGVRSERRSRRKP
jgi:hypothetical protein